MFNNSSKINQPQSESLNDINPGGENRVVNFFSFFFDLVKTFVIVMLLAFAIRYFVIQPFVVDGDSMLPSFVNNEYLIAEKISYDFKPPVRGDAVIFRYPKNPEIIYIKRVIGLPGEIVEIKDGKVYIAESTDNQPRELSENYVPATTKTYVYSESEKNQEYKVVLKDNEYFALGDNREHSSDSREWGVLPRANIIGRVWITVTPFDRFKFYGHHSYSLLKDFSGISFFSLR